MLFGTNGAGSKVRRPYLVTAPDGSNSRKAIFLKKIPTHKASFRERAPDILPRPLQIQQEQKQLRYLLRRVPL